MTTSAAVPNASSNLTVRLLTAAIGIPICYGAIWAGGPFFAVPGLLVVLLATWEFDRLAKGAKGEPSTSILFAGVFAVMVNAYVNGPALQLILTLVVALGFLWSVVRYEQGGSGFGWAWTIGGVLYVGWLSGHFLNLREMSQGREWVLFVFIVTFLNDTAAYTAGHLFGKRHFAPRLSPGKTWEGAVGALLVTAVATPFLAWLLALPMQPGLLVLGVMVSIAAQMGDLVESMLKRQAGVKDVSGLVPGHGGFLDRMDSLVFVGPLVYHYVRWYVAP